jgi:hypothetical protein
LLQAWLLDDARYVNAPRSPAVKEMGCSVNSTLTITVVELPDGTYRASCGGMSADAPTYAGAEDLLRDMLDMQWEANPGFRRAPVSMDPDILPDAEPEQ